MKQALLYIILIVLLSLVLVHCENNPSSPQQKIFQIWTMKSQTGEATLYHNSPNAFEGDGINMNGLSANITPLYLTHGDSHLWSVGAAQSLSKKILRIDPKTAMVTEMDLPNPLLDAEAGGLAWKDGVLWGVFLVGTTFRVYTINPNNMDCTEQVQFTLNYSHLNRRIRGIDVDGENNLLWLGVANYPFLSPSYFLHYDAYDLTSGDFVRSVQPANVYFDQWAGDIRVGNDYIWSTNKNDYGDIKIYKTNKENGAFERLDATDAGGDGITF